MPKVKLIFILGFLVLFITTLFFYIKFDSVGFDHKFKSYLAWHNPSDRNMDSFYELSKSEHFLNSIGASGKVFENNMEIFDFLRSKQSEITNLDAILKDKREAKVPINFSEETGIDINIPEGISYTIPGKLGYDVYNYDLVLFSPDLNTLSSKYLNLKLQRIEPESKKSLAGGNSIEESQEQIVSDFENFLDDLNNPEDSNLNLNDISLEKLENKEILENVSVNRVTFIEKEFPEEEYSVELAVGEISIHLENCFRDFSLTISYSPESGKLDFGDPDEIVKNLCRKQFIKSEAGYLIGTCEDCTFYPADKTHALRSDYAPSLAGIGFAPGNQVISTKAYQDFLELYNAAKSDGAFIHVTSGYRSYSTQAATFNAWVQTELAQGYSQTQAEAIANSYSARPGFSEHQLGTALDLNGAGCGTFTDGGCSSNQTVWDWLAENAYKFGFVISYPEGKTAETGYTFEPWHYRWIGKKLALEYVNSGGGSTVTLNKFLLLHGDY